MLIAHSFDKLIHYQVFVNWIFSRENKYEVSMGAQNFIELNVESFGFEKKCFSITEDKIFIILLFGYWYLCVRWNAYLKLNSI